VCLQTHFEQLCTQAANVSSPEHLPHYLHNAGIVFHRSEAVRRQYRARPGLRTCRARAGLPKLNAIMRFAHNVADILDVLSDTVRPCTLEDLERNGFS